MPDAQKIYAELFKLASASKEVQMAKEAIAIPTWGKVLGGAGLLGGTYGLGHILGKRSGREEAEAEGINPALAFGTGLATGLAGPKLMKGVGRALGATPGAEEFMSL